MAVGEPDDGLVARAADEVGIDPQAVRGGRIARKALDARQRRPRFVVHVDVVTDATYTSATLERGVRQGRVVRAPEVGSLVVGVRGEASIAHVVIVGAGPGGLFAALALARNGISATIVDRGPAIERRGRAVVAFHRTRVPNPEANLLFGEGGAGTYSDGKIYTRVDDALEVPLLEELVACGAPPEILYDARAHIGTDRLHRVLPALRARLEAAGVRFVFDTRVDGFVRVDDRIVAVRTTAGEMPCDAVVVATGHSARDAWEMLAAHGVRLEAKPFQLGLRIEHPQEVVDAGRHGTGPIAAALGAASYTLVAKATEGKPATYSFCMCPGGRIVAAVNEPGMLCTNGMSNARHSSGWATAAIVTTVGPEVFGPGVWAGVDYRERLEREWFAAGGSDYTAPAQRASDFVAGRASVQVRHSTYRFGTVPGRLDTMVPAFLRDAIARALVRFDRAIPGFAGDEGLFVGLESRSSGPIRIPRDPETRTAIGFANLYPVGEGAGYAGGIMSAALDGAHAALAVLRGSS